MDKQIAAEKIIEQALPLVPFEGWTTATLAKAAVAAGYKKTDAIRVFPAGAIEAVDAYARIIDRKMLEELEHYNFETMKIRERIAAAVRLRLELQTMHREAVRKAVAMHNMPFYAHHGLQALYETVDNIWYAIGDTSTDFNFYTKRLTLAAVYSSTLLFWLKDNSAGFEATWEFLNRRIENIMKIEKAKKKVKNWFYRTIN
jgi:ubiquinone biosynthesis protein COQ9